MEKMKYGNWIRTKVLWLLGTITFVFGSLALVPAPAMLRIFFGIAGLAFLGSFVYPLYSFVMFSQTGGNMQNRIYNLILDFLDERGPGKMLDIGAGNGILAIKAALKNRTLDVVGVDYWGKDWQYSKSVCEQNARIANVAEHVHFQKGDAASLNFPDATFDIVVSNLTFHEVKKVVSKIDVLEEALRVLKPGGKFVFIDYFYEDRYYGDAAGFELFLWSLKLKEVELKPLQEVLIFSRLLRHPRALGRVGIIYGKK